MKRIELRKSDEDKIIIKEDNGIITVKQIIKVDGAWDAIQIFIDSSGLCINPIQVTEAYIKFVEAFRLMGYDNE